MSDNGRRKLTEFVPDPRNANRGTERGLRMLEDSLRKYGAGRSILADRHGRIIAGNKTLERAIDIGLEDAIVVPTDGHQLVVVQRTDIDLDTKEGRELALADNRVAEVDLAWDADTLVALAEDCVDLSALWGGDELDVLLNRNPDEAWQSALSDLPTGDKAPFQQMTFTLSDAQALVVREALAKAKTGTADAVTDNENSNGNALWVICDAYLHG